MTTTAHRERARRSTRITWDGCMMAYRDLWMGLSVAVDLVGTFLAFALVHLALLVAHAALAVIACTLIHRSLVPVREPRGREPWREVSTARTVSVAAALGVSGFGAASPMLCVVLVLLLLATSLPWVVWVLVPTRPLKTEQSPVDPADLVMTVSGDGPIIRALRTVVTGWDDETLCRAWRQTYPRLVRAVPSERGRIVQQRQIYLDEIERRDPAAYTAWMNHQPRAASDPARYLNRNQPGKDRDPNE